MKKFLLIIAALVALGSVTGCSSYYKSPEYKAFKSFIKHCKADPKAADCKEWVENGSPDGGPD